jgi:hypothetical protein
LRESRNAEAGTPEADFWGGTVTPFMDMNKTYNPTHDPDFLDENPHELERQEMPDNETINGMKITLCGSAKFEQQFKEMNERLSLAGHVVYSLAIYPSDKGGDKDWYSPAQKERLDAVHFAKIRNSDAIYVIAPGNYIGESTQKEIDYARKLKKKIFSASPIDYLTKRTCPFAGCSDPLSVGPCALCYE